MPDTLDPDGPDAFGNFFETLQPALTETLHEPALEPSLMPDDWPGPGLREAVGRAVARHRPLVEDYLRAVLSPSG